MDNFSRTLHNDGEGEPPKQGALRADVRGALRDVGEDEGRAEQKEEAHDALEAAVKHQRHVQVQRRHGCWVLMDWLKGWS